MDLLGHLSKSNDYLYSSSLTSYDFIWLLLLNVIENWCNWTVIANYSQLQALHQLQLQLQTGYKCFNQLQLQLHGFGVIAITITITIT